jgi:WS/DGAT/MGAT family acyltransferase
MARDYLSGVDTAMLQMDGPTNPMEITTVMVFASPIDYARLKATIEVRLLGIRRFRQRLAWSRLGVGRPYWQDDPGFDLDYHLQRVHLGSSAPADQADLQKAVSFLASTPLDLSRPPWQLHLIENHGEGSALVVRSHHAIGDGVALVQVMLSLTDTDPKAPWPTAELQNRDLEEAPQRPVRSGLKAAHRSTNAVRQGASVLGHPPALRALGDLVKNAAADIGRFLVSEADPDTALRGELGLNKRIAWSGGVRLADIKAIREALGGTVNDVMLSVVAGSLRRYLEARGEGVDGISLRVMVPVDVRPPGDGGELGNWVGGMFVSLPINIADPVCRLDEMVRHVNGRKDSLQAPAFYRALNFLGRGPGWMTKGLVNSFGAKTTVVMTNVKGPQEQLYLAGAPVTKIVGWVPTTGGMAIGVSVFSYNGHVRLGVLTDAGLIPDPESIIAGFRAEVELLLDRVRDIIEERDQRN